VLAPTGLAAQLGEEELRVHRADEAPQRLAARGDDVRGALGLHGPGQAAEQRPDLLLDETDQRVAIAQGVVDREAQRLVVAAGAINSGDVRNGSLLGGDIRNGAITSSKVKDGTITSNDLSSGVKALLPANGTTTGFSAQEVVRKAGPASQPGAADVATLKGLAPGTYLLTAKTTIVSTRPDQGLGTVLQNPKTISAACTLSAGGDQDDARHPIITPYSNSPQTINLQLTRTTSAPIDVKLACSAPETTWRARAPARCAATASVTVATTSAGRR
jgi:hypothetical protein